MATHHFIRRSEGGYVAVIILFSVGVLSDRTLEGRQTQMNATGSQDLLQPTYQAMELVENIQKSQSPFTILRSHMRVQTRRRFVQCLKFVLRNPYGWHCHNDAAQYAKKRSMDIPSPD